MDPRIADYIRANRGQYTREAIIQQLVGAGHERAAVEGAWEQLSVEEPQVGGRGRNVATYVWSIYWLGAAIILAITLLTIIGSGSGGFGFLGFGVGWLVAYLLLAYLPARAMARARPTGTGGVLAVIVTFPLLILLIGGGICIGTIAIIAAGIG